MSTRRRVCEYAVLTIEKVCIHEWAVRLAGEIIEDTDHLFYALPKVWIDIHKPNYEC